jgi:hypothetical protein
VQRFVSVRGRAQLLDVLVAAQLALTAVQLVAWATAALVGNGALIHMLNRGRVAVATFESLLFVSATVLFAAWAFGVLANLPPLGIERRRMDPDTALVLSLVPLVNFVAVPLVARAAWLDTDPTPPVRGRVRAVLIAWYVGFALSLMAVKLLRGQIGRDLALVEMLGAAGWLLAGVACITAVRAVQRRQDEQWNDGELRRAVPQPTAEALR